MNKKFTPGQVILNIIFIAICLAFIIPFILVISISFSDEKSIIQYGYSLLPKVFSTEAYGVIFRNPHTILTAYKTTIIFTVVTMILAVFIMGLMAYPISRPTCRFRKFLSFFIFFTMLFKRKYTYPLPKSISLHNEPSNILTKTFVLKRAKKMRSMLISDLKKKREKIR